MKKKKLGRLVKMLFLTFLAVFIGRNIAYPKDFEAEILFDGSGSMKGFFVTGSIHNINNKIKQILAELNIVSEFKSQIFVTSDKRTEFYSFEEFNTKLNDYKETLENPERSKMKSPYGSETHLDEAYSLACDKSLLFMITDNVQDSGGCDYSNTQAFYQLLIEEKVHSVLLFPLRQQFEGNLLYCRDSFYDPQEILHELEQTNNNANFNQPETRGRYYSVFMKGNKALALYVIFHKPLPHDTFIRFIESSERILESETLVVKPVEQGNFVIECVNKETKIIRSSFKEIEDLCSEGSKARLAVKPPHLCLFTPKFNPYILSFKTEEEYFRLKPFKYKRYTYKPYRINRPMLFRFYFKMANHSPTIVLGKFDEQCSRKILIRLSNLSCGFPAPLNKYLSCDPNRDIKTLVEPNFIPKAITNPEFEDSITDSPFVSSAKIRIDPIKMHFNIKSLKDIFRNIDCIIRLAIPRSIPISIKGSVEIGVPPGYFSLNRYYDEAYFTRSQFDQSRIYTPKDIVSYINTTQTTLKYDLVSQDILVLPPLWVKILFYCSLVLLIIIILFIYIMITKCYYLKFDDTGEALRIHMPMPFSKGSYMRGENEIFLVKKGILFYIIRPADGYTIFYEDKPVHSLNLSNKGGFQIKGPVMNKVLVEPIYYPEYTNSMNQVRLQTHKHRKQKVQKAQKLKEDEVPDISPKRHDADKLFGPD